MSQSAITFDETGFERQDERDGVFIWFTPKGDRLGLFYYPIKPDIGAELHDVEGLRRFYRQSARQAGLGVIEIERVIVDSCLVVRTLFKATQEPAGRIYLGALTIPFQDFSYVLKVQCSEQGDRHAGYGSLNAVDGLRRERTGYKDRNYNELAR